MTRQGRSAIHVAARDGPLEALEVLTRMGDKPLPRDVDQKSPLDYARESGNKEATEYLEGKLAEWGSI